MSENKKLPQNRIAKLRKEKNLSQAQLAKETGLTRQAISLYEIGKREPKLETWLKLADFFDVPIPYLQGLNDTKESTAEELFSKYLDTLKDGQIIDVDNLDLSVYFHDDWLKRYFAFSSIFLNKDKDKYLIEMQNSIQNRKYFEGFSVTLRKLLEMFLNATTNHDEGSLKCYKELTELVRKYEEVDHSVFENDKHNHLVNDIQHHKVKVVRKSNNKMNRKDE